MKTSVRQLALMAALAGSATSIAVGQSLQTAVSDNGTGGVFMDLTPATAALNFNSFASYWTGTSTIEVYTRPGTYVGFDASSAGWTLTQTISGAVGAGTTTLADVTLTTPILLPLGSTTGIYLQPISGGGFRYTGLSGTPPQTTWSNADITLFSDVARTGLVSFGGTRNSPRCFAGRIDYSVAFVPTDPGACCKNDGTCSEGTFADCQTASGVFQGLNSLCSGVTCPQPVACCKNDGTCSDVPPAVCVAQGGTAQGAGSSCATAVCTGACCQPAGTCATLSQSACAAGGGIFHGIGSLCSGVTCAPFFAEVEPNETRAEATPVTLTASGQIIQGTTTGSVSTAGATSLDQFLIKTPAAALRVYLHRLAITTQGTAGHTGTIRGLTQTPAAPGVWAGVVGTATATDAVVQTSTTAAAFPRTNQWYGFGKQEQIYYRVTGAAATTAAYLVTYTTELAPLTDLGSTFQAGLFSISAVGQGHTSDTDLWVYDSNFNAIEGYGNDGASTFGGAAATSTQSHLRRELTAGTYYIAVSNTNLSNNKGSPSDDNNRTGAMLDFADAAANSSTTTGLNIAFSVTDGNSATTAVPATKADPYEVLWYKMTVTGTIPTGACCKTDGTCEALTEGQCAAIAGGVYSGNGTACATANCPQPGACCRPSGCVANLLPAACAAVSGTYQGAGSSCTACPPATVGALIGVNFAGTAQTISPQNWTRVSAAGTVSNLTDEGGAPTSAAVTLSGSGTISFIANSSVAANATPIYTYDLSSMNGYCFRSSVGDIQVVMSGLTPSRDYEYWFVGHRASLAVNNRVRVSDGDVLDAFEFEQHHTGSFFSVNTTSPANNTQQWESLSLVTTTSSTGAITFNVQATTDTTAIGALAVREILTTGGCYANCDASTAVPVLNVADFTCFLTKFAGGDPFANCDGSTSIPTLNVADFTCFLTKFAGGCP